MDMISDLEVIDICTKILQKVMPSSDDGGGARVPYESMDELRRDINYIQIELKVVGEKIDKLQIEVPPIILRRCVGLTLR